MDKRNYFRYSNKELEEYIKNSSCVTYVTGPMHVGFPPWGLSQFQETLTGIIKQQKIGTYDSKLGGIVLDIKNIKVLGNQFPICNDSASLHIDLLVGFYVFTPTVGSVIKGTVKHIAAGHISVTVFRLFNISIKLQKQPKALKLNSQILVNIIDFNFKDSIPVIEGALVENVDVSGGTEGNECKETTYSIKVEKKTRKRNSSTLNGSVNGSQNDKKVKQNNVQIKIKQERPSSDSSEDSEDEDDSSISKMNLSIDKKVIIKKEKKTPEKRLSKSKNLLKESLASLVHLIKNERDDLDDEQSQIDNSKRKNKLKKKKKT